MKNNCIKPHKRSIISENGEIYESISALGRKLNLDESSIRKRIKHHGYFKFNNIMYYLTDTNHYDNSNNIESVDMKTKVDTIMEKREDDIEYQQFKKMKEVEALPFELYNLDYNHIDCGSGYRYAVALFSDAHIEETVKPASVLGLNEYNTKIAEERIQKYFLHLVECLNEDMVDDLIFASLGDTISGFIHDELAQCNGMTPLEATRMAQNLIFSGLKYICENVELNTFRFIGIVGNHSRTTKKIQHANGYRLSYEWLMYKNIEDQCKIANLPIEFIIPESEFALVVAPDGKKLLFAHGFQVRTGGTGTVCGIYPGLNRQCLRWKQAVGQDMVYIGHYHSCVAIPNAIVNGSIIGYNSFALTNAMPYEEPAQMYALYDTKMGSLLTRQIYCK